MTIALGTLAMLLGNVGLQVFNNWCNNRQNDELQRKKEEFERAAREHQTDRMWKILREGQALTLELEKAKQEQRIEELESEMGQLLQTLAYQATIENWPLGVLPIVMKNQALGNLLAHQEESFALHCIFTPSNYPTFNKCVFPRIEQALEEYCNKYWSPASTHPILFYSGAWKSNDAPSGTQTNSMRSALSNLPTLMVTPFFRPTDDKLVFQIHMWGVGASTTDQFDVPEIEPKSDEFHFQRTYTNKLDYEKEAGLLDEIVEDLVPYLQCLIGFMADTYFWSSAGLKPQLPHLVTNGTINTDGMKYLVSDSREYYNSLLLTGEERAKENPFAQDNLLNLYEGCAELWDEESRNNKKEECLLSLAQSITCNCYSSIKDLCSERTIQSFDVTLIDKIIELLQKFDYMSLSRQIELIKDNMVFDTVDEIDKDNSEDIEILCNTDINYLNNLSSNGNCVAMYRLGELYEYSIGCDMNFEKAIECYQAAASVDYILAILKLELLHFLSGDISNVNRIKNYKKDLEELIEKEVIQAIILAVAFSYYEIYSFIKKDELLTTLDKVEDSDHPYAYYLGALIINKLYGKEYVDNIITLLKKSCELGYTKAALELADIYKDGLLTDKSAAKYIEYNKFAAKKGSPEALTNIGYCFATGFGVQKSKSNAIYYFKMAAELGDRDAIQILNGIKK